LEDHRKRKAVALWLLAGVFMIIVQTLLGGITRLTGSGLSITEWKPIMGAIPPLNEKEWNLAFDGYKHTGQFKYLNSDFTLSDFKFIFFWEWIHRLWARLLGVVFIVGFIWFLVKKYFDKGMMQPFIILFLLGALQGVIGWIMVISGLNDTHLYVDHIRLATHFVAAMILACYTLWFALQLLIPAEQRVTDNRLHNFTLIIISLLFLQLVYGAFMAGLKAATSAPTWPTINGEWIPGKLFSESLINNNINVHFIHRELAYILFVLLIWWFVKALKLSKIKAQPLFKKSLKWPAILIVLQLLLGICTILSAPTMVVGKFGQYQFLAELHQLTAMFLLMSLLVNLYVVKKTTY